jgi:bifunctional DNase/RNase
MQEAKIVSLVTEWTEETRARYGADWDLAGTGLVELESADGTGRCKVFMMIPEVRSIGRALNGVTPARPMAHDLFARGLQAVGARVLEARITGLEDTTFLAELDICHGVETVVLDARPSDAIAMALHFGAPTFVSEEILQPS